MTIVAITGCLFGLTFVLVSASSFRRKRWQLNQPFVVFSMLFGSIYFLLPAWQMVSESFRFSSSYDPWAVLLTHAYLLAYWGGAWITFHFFGRKCGEPIGGHSIGYQGLLVAVCFLLLPGLVAAIYLQLQLPGLGDSGFMANRISLLRGLGGWLMMTYLLYGFTTLVAVYLLSQRRVLAKKGVVFTLLLLLAVFVSFRTYYLLGTRQTMMYPILATMISASAIGVLGGRRLAIAGSVVAFAFGAMLYMGATRMYESATEVEVNYTEQLANAVGNGELLIWNIQNRQSFELIGGGTFVAAATSFVPRSVLPDKPLGGGPALMNRIYPGSYALYMDNVSSITTGLPVEGFMNFGFIGSVLVGILHGLAIAWLTRMWPAWSSDAFGHALYGIIFLGLCYTLLTNEFLGAFMRTTFVAGVIWFTREVARVASRK